MTSSDDHEICMCTMSTEWKYKLLRSQFNLGYCKSINGSPDLPGPIMWDRSLKEFLFL